MIRLLRLALACILQQSLQRQRDICTIDLFLLTVATTINIDIVIAVTAAFATGHDRL